MQLSAPTLPIDPGASRSADATGFPPTGGKADADASSRSDFGAMLSAESRGNNRGSSAARTNPRAAAKAADGQVDDQGSLDSSRGDRSASSAHPGQTGTAAATTPEALAIAAGLNVPTSTVPVQEPAVPAIDLTLNSPSPAVSTVGADTPQESLTSADESVASSRLVAGRPFTGEMLAGKSRAGLHAYGLRGESPTGSVPSAVPAQAPARGLGMSPAAVVARTAPVQSVDSAESPIVLPMALSESTEPGSRPSLPNTLPTTASSVAETSILAVQGAVMPGSKVAPSVSTDAAQMDQVAEGSAELAAAILDEAQRVADESVEPKNTPSLIQKVSGDGPEDGAEMTAPAATSAIAEKIAAELSRSENRLAGLAKNTQRVPLITDNKHVESSYGRIGINVAKPETLMPAHASTPTPATIAIEHASFAASPLSFDNLVKEGGEGTHGQMAQVARRAVESALAVADQYITGDQRSVKLQFTVGGEQLAVRVELKGNQVHTTFRTDSPELRSALAQEWQSVSAAQTGVRPQRLADPVFASNSSTGQGMSSDSGAAHQRDSGARHPHTTPEEVFSVRHSFPTTPAAPAVAVTTAVTAAREPSSLRLQTFA